MIEEKQLIEVLKRQKHVLTFEDSNPIDEGFNYGIDKAIQLVSVQPKVGEWIPCNERLPEEKKFYEELVRSPACLVTVLSDDELMVGIDRTVNGVWTLEETFDKPKIIAWQPLLDGYECHSKKLEKNSKGETE